jgi:hypothetical protein
VGFSSRDSSSRSLTCMVMDLPLSARVRVSIVSWPFPPFGFHSVAPQPCKKTGESTRIRVLTSSPP